MSKSKGTTHVSSGDIVVTVSITVRVVLSIAPVGNQNDETPKESKASEPTPPPVALRLDKAAFIETYFPEYTRAALDDVASSQSKAFEWLWEEDDPSLPIWRQVQQFALATCAISLTESDDIFPELQLGGWLTANHECIWPTNSPTFDVCDLLGNYQHFNVAALGLIGVIPPEIALLSELMIIDVSMNQGVHGTLPSEVGLLQQLEELVLVETQMVSKEGIPATF